MAWIEPKTDWTSEDDYDYPDLNRVENNVSHVEVFMRTFGYPVPTFTNKTDWSGDKWPYLTDMDRIEGNMKTLSDLLGFSPFGDKPPKVTWVSGRVQPFSFEDANRLELNISLLLIWATNITKSAHYCGAFICGEGLEF